MIDLPTARALVEKELAKDHETQVIIDILPIEDLGWIFPCGTHALNEPARVIVVDQKDGWLRHIQITKLPEVSRTQKLTH